MLPAGLRPEAEDQTVEVVLAGVEVALAEAVLVEAVLEATRRLLVDEGFEALSMARIAKVAGVGPGSLYQYFPSVDSLMVVLYERMRTRELEALEGVLASTQGMPLRPAVEALLFGLAGLLNTQRPLATELAKWVPVLDPEEEKIAPIDRQVQGLLVTFLGGITFHDRERAPATRARKPSIIDWSGLFS